MKSNTLRRKPGRPTSGKKNFSVRMLPSTYALLCKAARDDGFDHLGDWLAHLPGLDVVSQGLNGSVKSRVARRNFLTIAGNAREQLDALLELVDFEVALLKDDEVWSAAKALEASYRKLHGFINHEKPQRK